MDTDTLIRSRTEALIADGYTVRCWTGRSGARYYLTDSYGAAVGYLLEADLTSDSPRCERIDRRRGYVCSILRGVQS